MFMYICARTDNAVRKYDKMKEALCLLVGLKSDKLQMESRYCMA